MFPDGCMLKTIKPLTPAEESRVVEILKLLADNALRRRLMMYPYFKDYDRSGAYTRVVTKTQFGRILHFLSLNVSPEDLKLLCRKFEEPSSGDVNYPAFVQAVDQEFVGHTLEDVNLQDESLTNVPVPERLVLDPNVTYPELMARIRHIALTNRLRLGEFFDDYDPLRSGSISKSQFRRALGLLGLGKLGSHDLVDSQYDMLCDYYQDPAKRDQVLFANFIKDIENVFTEPNLERDPTYQVPPSEMFRVPKPGTVSWDYASENHKELFDKTMDRLRERTEQRRVLAKPVFRDFDKHNNGHVTRSQFRQCLMMLELIASEPELAALEARFCNDGGFNYLDFLGELIPEAPPQLMYKARLQTIRQANEKGKLPEQNPAGDL